MMPILTTSPTSLAKSLVTCMLCALLSGSLSAGECSLFPQLHRKLANDCDAMSNCDGMACDSSSCDAMTADHLLFAEPGHCSCSACRGDEGNKSRRCCLKWGDGSSCLDFLPRTDLCFPLFREAAESRGATLPLPVGFSIVSTVLKRNVVVEDVRIGLGNSPPVSLERVNVNEFDTRATSEVARADLWVLPCLNFYAVAGHTRTTGDLVVDVERFPFPNSPPFSIPITIQLSGFTYGGGGTVAIGTPKHFATLDVNYTHTDFDLLANELFALVIAPRFGRVIDHPCYQGEFHLGAMYQDTRQTIEIEQDSPVGPIKVSVDQIEPRPWNFLFGTLWAIDERLHAIVEFGFGGREYVISGLTARF